LEYALLSAVLKQTVGPQNKTLSLRAAFLPMLILRWNNCHSCSKSGYQLADNLAEGDVFIFGSG
jgi:hypothetical protein